MTYLLTTSVANSYLGALGFRGSFSTRVRNFQKGWNLGPWLKVDGLYGPATDAALRKSHYNQTKGLATASAHFSFAEFRCTCFGRYASCQGVWIHRVQLNRLESARVHIGPIRVVSGCRCYGRNKEVGGATNSQHLYGAATDIPGSTSVAMVKSWKLFAGIGYSASTGRVLHVDSRDVSGQNGTGGSPSNPTVWQYA